MVFCYIHTQKELTDNLWICRMWLTFDQLTFLVLTFLSWFNDKPNGDELIRVVRAWIVLWMRGRLLTHKIYFWVATDVSNSISDCILRLWNFANHSKVMTTHWDKLWALKLFSAINKHLESCPRRNYLLRIISVRRDCFSCQCPAITLPLSFKSLSVTSCATGHSTVPNLSI